MTAEAGQGLPQAEAAPAPIDPKRIAETLTLARFRAAEDRIYPLIMVDPSLYQQAVECVARVCGALRARALSREELLSLDTVEITTNVMSDPELFAQSSALNAAAGLSPTTLVEAAIAQLVSLSPPANQAPSPAPPVPPADRAPKGAPR